MNNHFQKFLSQVSPFDNLSEVDLKQAAQALSISHHYKDMTLFVQGKTSLNYVYIVFQGRLEQYILEDNEKSVRSFINEKEIYGALSILFNKGISIRTVRCLEDVILYRLPKDIFLELCSKNVEFTQYFSTLFGQNIQEKPYLSLIAQSCHTQEEGLSSGFLNRSLSNISMRDVVSCPVDWTVHEAAKLMTEKKQSAIVVRDNNGNHVGLLTDHDLREKVLAGHGNVNVFVSEVMSSPLVTISSSAQIFEAILQMMQYNIKHLAITDESDKLHGMATDQDLLLAQGRSPVFLMHEVQKAETVEEMALRQKQLPNVVGVLIEEGARAEHLNRVITSFSDAILKKVIRLSLQETGPPPVKFVFMILGSEGRKEQTLKTDQDNAIIFEDVPKSEQKEVQDYFLNLGEKVCYRLDQAGYDYCEFNIMAQNPQWCQPLSQWKSYFHNWIYNASPEDLLKASIFFDFRAGYGEQDLIDKLWDELQTYLSGWVGFFRHLAENALHFKPPLDFFGNFVLKSKGKKKNVLDIKTPMRLMVDFARIYSLKNGIPYTNTLERLQEMQLRKILDLEDFEDITYAYSYMMQIRLNHQVNNLIERQIPADNDVQPKELTHVEQQALKEALKRIRMAQGMMKMELTQEIGIA